MLADNQGHPLRAAARLMKQKADHHLTFLADKNDRSATNILKHLPSRHTSVSANVPRTKEETPARTIDTHSSSAKFQPNGHGNGISNGNGNGEEDAAGEDGEKEEDFREGAKMAEGKSGRSGSGESQLQECRSKAAVGLTGLRCSINRSLLTFSPSRS
jgi:transcriptional activator SPT7